MGERGSVSTKENNNTMKVNQLKNQFGARNKRLRRKGINYLEFLKSKIWADTKIYLRKFEEYKKCKICSSNKNLNMHHTSYVDIFKPSLKKRKRHIVALCEKCHHKVHEVAQANNLGLNQSIKWILRKSLKTIK